MSNLRARRALVVCLTALLQACADSGSSSHPENGANVGAEQADVVALCGAICDRSARCGFSDAADGSCEPDCMSGSARPELLRGDVVRGLSACEGAVACEDSDDACLEQVVEDLQIDYMNSALLQQCYDIHDQCGGFSDDDCADAVLFTDAGKAQLGACLSSSCDAVGSCIQGLSQGP